MKKLNLTPEQIKFNELIYNLSIPYNVSLNVDHCLTSNKAILENCYDESYFMLKRSKLKGKSVITYHSHYSNPNETAYTLVFDEDHNLVYDSGFHFTSNLSEKVARKFVNSGNIPTSEEIDKFTKSELQSIDIQNKRVEKSVNEFLSKLKS